MKQTPIYIVWEYDDGIVPNKNIVGIYLSYDEANKVKKKYWDARPEYEYAVETTSLWGEIIKPTREQLENWLDTLNYWYEHVEDYAERYPDMKNMVDKFSRTIDEIYEHTKEL